MVFWSRRAPPETRHLFPQQSTGADPAGRVWKLLLATVGLFEHAEGRGRGPAPEGGWHFWGSSAIKWKLFEPGLLVLWSILQEISPEYSLEGRMLKLKLQYFGLLIQRTDSLEKTLMLRNMKAGGEGEDRICDGCMASPA